MSSTRRDAIAGRRPAFGASHVRFTVFDPRESELRILPRQVYPLGQAGVRLAAGASDPRRLQVEAKSRALVIVAVSLDQDAITVIASTRKAWALDASPKFEM